MNFKLKTLVAAVVLSAAATSANAAIDTNAGNSELVFSAWDSVAGVGYTYDLNWSKFLNDFVGADTAATTAGNTTLLANAKVGASMIGAGGLIYDDVLTGLPFGANIADVQWNLNAVDNVGRTRLLTTKDSLDATLFTPTSNQSKAAVTGLAGYYAASEGYAPSAIGSDTYVVAPEAALDAYAGLMGSGIVNNVADTTNVLGGQSFLYLLAQSTQASSANAALQTQLLSFDGQQIVAKTYLSGGEWRLNISSVSTTPVPEADSSAMLLAGLGLMGFIARRRNKSAK